MIKVDCAKCGNELHVPGAVIMSSPKDNNKYEKDYLCVTCEEKLRTWIKGITSITR